MVQHLASTRTKIMARPRISIASLVVFVFLSTHSTAFAQSSASQQNTRDSGSADAKRLPQPSDLSNENFEHLAAAPRQIQEVLLKDTGLLVELKRLAIKEATDNGQIVEDSSLTDQAIFDRLERDIRFRSLATRLVQRYGYLLPTFNPDSELGKERDFILKERARRQTQLEAEEDANVGSQITRQARDVEAPDNCDPARAGCEPPARRTPRRANGPSNAPPEI